MGSDPVKQSLPTSDLDQAAPLPADAPGRAAPIYPVLLVDDRPELRALLRTRLGFERDIEVVGEASNGEEAIRLAKVLSPSAVVLDLEMPVMRGDEAIPMLRKVAPGMGILLFTGTDRLHLAEDAMPDVLVRKGAPLGIVVEHLRAVLKMMPFDVVRLDLGTLPIEQAVTAFDTWTGLNMRVLHALERGDELDVDQLSGASAEELEALMGVYAHIGHNLQTAARAHADTVSPVVHIFRATGVLARAALLAFNNHRLPAFWKAWGYDVPEDAVTALSLMRDRLMDVLPPSTGRDEFDEVGRSAAAERRQPLR
jgi:DNA-binding NarL/FixJ family response regulator